MDSAENPSEVRQKIQPWRTWHTPTHEIGDGTRPNITVDNYHEGNPCNRSLVWMEEVRAKCTVAGANTG